jgi:hypothetical protein
MRPLNDKEKEIVRKKTERTGIEYTVVGVEYRTAFPRSTVCLIHIGIVGEDILDNLVIGNAMRAKYEDDIPEVGQVIAFTRALDQMKTKCFYMR